MSGEERLVRAPARPLLPADDCPWESCLIGEYSCRSPMSRKGRAVGSAVGTVAFAAGVAMGETVAVGMEGPVVGTVVAVVTPV